MPLKGDSLKCLRGQTALWLHSGSIFHNIHKNARKIIMGRDNPETKRRWNEANREKLLEQQRARRRLHPERTKRQNDKYKSEHPDRKKAADKKYQQENRAHVRENARLWRARNKDKVKANTKKWREENPEKMQASRDKWLSKNVDYKRQKEAEWRADNVDRTSIKGRKRYRAKKDHILVVTKKWQKANPHKTKQIGTRRRARLLGATIGDTKEIEAWEKDWRSKESVECTYCHQSFHPTGCDTDHVIPISRPEIGGVHALHNLAIACAWCNRSKGDRTVEEWEAVKLSHPNVTAAPVPSECSLPDPQG